MKKYFLLFFLLSLLVVDYAASDQPIKIGVLTDLSGPAAFYGEQTRVGALLAKQDLEANGEQIEIIFEDSALSTTRGLSAAQKLIFVDQVTSAYVDFTVIAIAVSPLFEQHKKLLLYSAAAESVVKQNPYAFKTYSDYQLGCEAMTREFLKLGLKKIGVLKAESEYGELCLQGANKATKVFEESYRRGEPVNTQMLNFKKQGVEAVINGCFEGDVINMLKASSDINYPVRIGINEDTITKDLEARYAAKLNGSLTFGIQRTSEQLISKSNLLKEGSNLSGYEGVSLAYLHINQLYAAGKKCKNQQIDCQINTLSKSAPDLQNGFAGWKDRIAKLRTIIKKYEKDNLTELGVYITND